MDALRFTATVAQVKTMADGGLRISLDLPESAVDIIASFIMVKQNGGVLECAAIPVLQERNRENGKIPTRSEWESKGQTEEG